MTAKLAQPYRKAHTVPYASRRYAYCPPASGHAAASSAIDSAPSNDTIPPITQTSVITAVPWTAAATVAGTMKIAEAIIVPALIITASKRPSSRLRSLGAAAGGVWKVMGVGSGEWSLTHDKVPLPTPYSHVFRSERCVGIEIQTPAGRRPRCPSEIAAQEPVDETRAHADSGQRPDKREVLARAGVSDVREQHHTCGRPTIRELEACAPERVAAGRIPAIAANRPRTAQIPGALGRDDAVGHAA